MKHLEELIYVCYGGENPGSTGEIESEDPFSGLGSEEGHRGWILSSCCLAQTAAATLSCHKCGEASSHRTRLDLSHSTSQGSFAAAYPHRVA